jgi:peptidoglycan L-alanyl-D-glutamate endopeptidase CwlK
MDSRHLTGHAVHFIPWPVEWDNTKRFYYFGGYALSRAKILNIPIRWGGDWDRDHDLDDQQFFDLIHFEIPKSEVDDYV